jgi:tetratricopeptide (TPR) repeat protein
LALALAPAGVEAQDPPNVVQAREHLDRGTALLEQGNYDAALVEFMRAYDLVGEHPARPLILFNIARAHERLFRYDQALQYYNRFLQEAPADQPRRGEVQGTITALEGLLATVQITSNVPAEVWVDDREVGTSPGSVRIPGGSHVVLLRAEGYQDSRQQIQVAARETTALTFNLGELAAQYRGISSIFFWGATGLAAAAALAGGAMGIVALTRRGDVDTQLMDPVLRHDGGSLEAARAEIETYALVADVLFGTAGVFAITAVVLAFLTDWGGAPAEEAATADLQLVPVVGPSFTGLSLGGSF